MAAGRLIKFARGGALVFNFTGTIGAGALLGWFADSKLGTEPWGVLILTLVGVVGGFIRLVQIVRHFDRLDDAAEH